MNCHWRTREVKPPERVCDRQSGVDQTPCGPRDKDESDWIEQSLCRPCEQYDDGVCLKTVGRRRKIRRQIINRIREGIKQCPQWKW